MSEVVVIDASVIILLAAPPLEKDSDELKKRRLRASESMSEMVRDKARFIIPAPVVVELMRDGDWKTFSAKFLAKLGNIRVDALDVSAAEAAGVSLRKNMQNRPQGESRNAVKFDALIAGIAHARNATAIATANPRDFEKHLSEMGSTINVIRVDAPRQVGQLRLIDSA